MDEALDRLRALVRDAATAPLVTRFFAGDPADEQSGGFAGLTFLEIGDNLQDHFSRDDFLAVTLLDVRLRPAAIRLLQSSPTYTSELDTMLADVPADVRIWHATDEVLAAAARVWKRLKTLPWVDYVTAGKLLARKRPHLIPIVDRVVERVVQAPRDQYWNTFKTFLADTEERAEVDHLGRLLDLPVPTLRVLDAAIWMQGSNAMSVRSARNALNLPEEPRYPLDAASESEGHRGLNEDEVDEVKSSWLDPTFYKHAPCKFCGSTDLSATEDDDAGEISEWKCRSCGQMTP